MKFSKINCIGKLPTSFKEKLFEKTAIVMSIFLPDYICLATRSLGNFKFELLAPLKKRNIIAFSDKGEYNSWLNKAKNLKALGLKIGVSDLLKT